MNDEERITDPATGGAKGRKLARFDLIPVGPLTEVARLYGAGAAKYADRNWELGYAWSLSYAAAMRHLTQFWDGESLDPETKRHHLASVIFHAMALMEYEATGKGTDDRPLALPSEVTRFMRSPVPVSQKTWNERVGLPADVEWISVADSKAEQYEDGEVTIADVLPPDVDSPFDVAPADPEEPTKFGTPPSHQHYANDHDANSPLSIHKGCVPCPEPGCPCHHKIGG